MSVVRDSEVPKPVRIDAAGKAAPYVHPKLASSEVNFNTGSRHVEEMTDQELNARILAGLLDRDDEFGSRAHALLDEYLDHANRSNDSET